MRHRIDNCLNTPLPCYYPTTVVVVDDNEDFLYDLTLQIDDRVAFKLFTSPVEALCYINGSVPDELSQPRCHESDYLLDLREMVSALKKQLDNPARFTTTSVVVADYHMPGMDGLSFCQNIKDPNTKKILFTATLDEHQAIDSFNDGVIDKFITKQEDQNLAIMNHFIRRCQQDYFSDRFRLLEQLKNTTLYDFIAQSSFARLFDSLCQQFGVVEYYLTNDPKGYLLVTRDHKLLRLLVVREDDMVAWDKRDDKKAFLLPFSLLEATEYYCALIVEQDVLTEVASYRDYIDELDEAMTSSEM